MKIKFRPNLDYQRDAIASVVDIFEGQKVYQDCLDDVEHQSGADPLGIGNQLNLQVDELLKKVREIQLRNGLEASQALDGMNFSIEMETGTGKTYVYLRTIFELHKKYGFTKYIVVVPSIAIKEGVYKTLQITGQHIRSLYDNVRYDFFVYDSQKLGQVRSFANSDCVQIMVINIDAFRKSFKEPESLDKANIIHRPHDAMTGRRPIEFIQATNPIVIIDEPQSVDTTSKSRDAIASLNPLCTLRYSATHKERYNQVYRLDAVDAYERNLVKQIEVIGIDRKATHNQPYVRMIGVSNKKSPISAQVELDVQQRGGQVQRTKKVVKAGDDLCELSGGREIYADYVIDEIRCEPGRESIRFTNQPTMLERGQAIGDFGQDIAKRLQIRNTIQAHLDKELRLVPRGIKVLSLIFIDRVANYRGYDEDGNPCPGKYARIFEEEYLQLIAQPKYSAVLKGMDLDAAIEGIHDGYFAIDKKKDAKGAARLKESRGSGTASADESAYQLIMRDKEKLLSLDSKLRFIFSHSALKEGWDNPNVFQICTLNESASVTKKRQEIGRGLRIAVDQSGERVEGFEVNTLTVIANESYEAFATKLQKELEDEVGIRFGIVETQLFVNLAIDAGEGADQRLGLDASQAIWEHLRERGYIDAEGKVQDKLRVDLARRRLELPDRYVEYADAILHRLKRVAGTVKINQANKGGSTKRSKAVHLGTEFRALWERIGHRTSFRVSFDPQQLIQNCVQEIKASLVVDDARLVVRKSQAQLTRSGIHMGASEEQSYGYEDTVDLARFDIVACLQRETKLTRRSIVEILLQSERLESFKRNPQAFIEQCTAIIRRQMRRLIGAGVKYEQIGEAQCAVQELYESEELHGHLEQKMLQGLKLIGVEESEDEFARRFELSDEVKVYGRLPKSFQLETPLGPYHPDWAVLVERDRKHRIFFVAESKDPWFQARE